MIKSLYFDNTAYQYAYELERLIRNFSLPHRLEFYTDRIPDGTDYAYFAPITANYPLPYLIMIPCIRNPQTSVSRPIMRMSFAGFFADVWKGTVTLRFRGEYLREYAP